MLTNEFLHFRVISILMYYLRYRAGIARQLPNFALAGELNGSTQLPEVRQRHRTHRQSVQGQRPCLHT